MGVAEARATRRSANCCLLGIGAAIAGGGLYFALVGFSLWPGPSKLIGLNWLAVAVGLVFFAAVRACWCAACWRARQPAQFAGRRAGGLQAHPMGSDVPGHRQHGLDRKLDRLPPRPARLLDLAADLGLARRRGRPQVFGIGAIITWLMAVLVAYAGIMKMLGKKP